MDANAPHDVTDATPDKLHAALFMRIGREAKFSRSGYSIVFAAPVYGRADLSSHRPLALRQLEAAGIDPDSVTEADLAAYRGWRDGLHHARRIAQARILVSRPFAIERGRSLVPANRVSLIDGWGVLIDDILVSQVEIWDPEATPRVGAPGPGAYCHRADVDGVAAAINELRGRHPQFYAAEIKDNSGEFGTRSR